MGFVSKFRQCDFQSGKTLSADNFFYLQKCETERGLLFENEIDVGHVRLVNIWVRERGIFVRLLSPARKSETRILEFLWGSEETSRNARCSERTPASFAKKVCEKNYARIFSEVDRHLLTAKLELDALHLCCLVRRDATCAREHHQLANLTKSPEFSEKKWLRKFRLSDPIQFLDRPHDTFPNRERKRKGSSIAKTTSRA